MHTGRICWAKLKKRQRPNPNVHTHTDSKAAAIYTACCEEAQQRLCTYCHSWQKCPWLQPTNEWQKHDWVAALLIFIKRCHLKVQLDVKTQKNKSKMWKSWVPLPCLTHPVMWLLHKLQYWCWNGKLCRPIAKPSLHFTPDGRQNYVKARLLWTTAGLICDTSVWPHYGLKTSLSSK